MRLLLLLLSLSVGASAVAKKAEPIHTVIYDYSKWSLSGHLGYALLPKSAQIKPGIFQDRVRALFKRLMKSKRATYGKARLAFQPNAAQSGVVWVYLDSKKAQYHPIVMAETVYTFTENGASKVIFPKVQERGWTRADVPFPAYRLSLPLWKVLPPSPIKSGLAQMPDGSFQRAELIRKGLKEEEPGMIKAIWSYLSSGPPAASLAAVRVAQGLKDRAERLLPVLESADRKLRTAALNSLAGIDSEPVNLVVRKMMDSDPDSSIKGQAALFLSRSKDPSFSVAAQYYALRSEDPNTVAQAAKALGESKEAEAREQLLERLGHKAAQVRAAVIASLFKRKEHSTLVKSLRDDQLEAGVRLEIARALSQEKQAKSQHAGLLHLVVHGKLKDSVRSSQQLAKRGGTDTLNALGEALKHSSPEARRAAAEALVKIGKPEGLKLLATADLSDKETGAEMERAMRAIYALQSLKYVLKAKGSKNSALRRAAVATLGEMVQKKQSKREIKLVLKALKALAKVKDPLVRAAAARSFGDLADPSSKGEVLKLAKDRAVEVRRAAALGLGSFKGEESIKLLLDLAFLKKQDPIILANSLSSLGRLKARAALDVIVKNLNSKDVRVRRAATGALVSLGEILKKRKPLFSLFSDRAFDDDVQVRIYALDGLLLTQDSNMIKIIAALLQDPSSKLKKAALRTLGRSGEAIAVEDIVSALEDDDLEIRAAALEALKVLGEPDAAKPLKAYIAREESKKLKKQARKVLKALKKR